MKGRDFRGKRLLALALAIAMLVSLTDMTFVTAGIVWAEAEETTVSEETGEADETTEAEETTVSEETTAAEETGEADETTEAEETTVSEETTAADETTEAEETTAAEETGEADETTEAEETTAAEETTEAEETTAAEETTEAEETTVSEETTAAEETDEAEEPSAGDGWIDGGRVVDTWELETSVPFGIQPFSLDDGMVALKEGNYEKWIDRIEAPAEFRAVYDKLAEGSDHDGNEDILINDSAFETDSLSKMPFVELPVTTFEITVEQESSIADEVRKVYLKYKNYLAAVYSAFDRDHPEVFWLGNGWSSVYSTQYKPTGDQTGYLCKVKIFLRLSRTNRYPNEQTIRDAIAERDANIKQILENAPANSDYELIRYFNDVLTKKNQYNTVVASNSSAEPEKDVNPDAWECVSALEGRMGDEGPVCEGYARAFQVLCAEKGIPCTLVDGMAGGGGHMWNYVELDGAWYGVDVTWNDPVVNSSTQPASGSESTD